MVTSLAAQLAQIAVNSKISLDIKAQKAAHSKSLLFEPRVAAGQTFQAVYTVCRDGFDELCQLDERFVPFAQTLFSELSMDEDRVQLDEAACTELDRRIESFLRLVGSRLRLLPAIKSVEWLIRRFRIHEFNTTTLIATFLPYHAIPVFTTLMSILPQKTLPHDFRFLSPYVRSLTAPPRAAIVQHATQHFNFLAAITQHTLAAAKAEQHYPGLVTFWGGVMTEAVNGMLDKNRSGRAAVQADNDQTILQQVGPLLGEALMLAQAPGVQIAAYMVVSVFVSKAQLGDAAISAFMEQVVQGWTAETVKTGLVCLSMLAQQRSAKQLSRRVAKAVLRVPDVALLLVEIGRQRRIDKLANGLVLALTERLAKKAKTKGAAVRTLPVIKAILLGGLLQDKQLAVAFKTLLVVAHGIDDATDPDGSVRKELGTTLIVLSQAPEHAGGVIIRKVIEDEAFDVEELELKLDATIRPKLLLEAAAVEAGAEDAVMANAGDDDDAAAAVRTSITKQDLDATATRLAAVPRPTSCLAQDADSVFEQFCQLFLATASFDRAELDQLDATPLLGRADAVPDLFYLTFCMRMWSGPYPTLARVAALDMAAARLRQADCAGVDFQAVLPYCIAALSDAAKKVRRAAAGLLAALKAAAPKKEGKESKSAAAKNRWGSTNKVYTEGGEGAATTLAWLTADARGSLYEVLAGSSDEAVLHEDHLPAVLADVLNKSGTADNTGVRLSHSVRLSILECLCSHAVLTPLWATKVRLLKTLNAVRGVSGTNRTQLLLPVLSAWAGLDAATATATASREGLDEAVVDARAVDVVLPNETSGLEVLFEVIKKAASGEREHLVSCAFKRIRTMWPATKEDFRSVTAQFMLEQVQKATPDEQDVAAEEATDLLYHVELSTAVLGRFLDALQQAAKMATATPPNKRRRASSSASENKRTPTNSEELRQLVNRATFVLQLVQGSKPAEHPELLPSLFVVLSDLQILRTYVGSELGYLQNVVLSCLLAMMPAYEAASRDKTRGGNLTIDTSAGHGDVLVNCIHKSSSPAVQNTALLLVASLAKTAPDVVLHSVMPIFTLMGTSVLRQSDDYSAHVVNQTIREVIPPLIATFQRGKRNVVASAADLLSSFVIAYEHIPSHRKHDLFISLTENLGADAFLFAICAMFADRYGTADSTCDFLTELLGSFAVETQLQSLVKFVALTADLFAAQPGLAATLLGGKRGSGDNSHDDAETDLYKTALKQLTLLPHLLANRRLKDELSRLDAADENMTTAKMRELYIQLLEDLLTLADTVMKTNSGSNNLTTARRQQLHGRCGDALAQLLSLQSIGEFLKAVEELLGRPNMSVRAKVLRALEVRVDAERVASAASRTALLAFLPQLTAVIRDSSDIAYKHTAVTCVDKIAEKYGRRDLEAVTAAAAAIAGDACLGQADPRLRVMALLCLASLVDVLQDAIVPVLPTAVPRALVYLIESLDTKKETTNVALHNAVYSFLTALAQHLPFMMTAANLDRLVAHSFASAEAGLSDKTDGDANASRLQCLLLLARQTETKTMLEVLRRNWPAAVRAGPAATLEYVQVLTAVIDKPGSKKQVVVKNLGLLSAIFHLAFDLRREARVSGGAIAATAAGTGGKTQDPRLSEIETAVNTAALHMVFKLNDTVFRPVFQDLMRWCDDGLPQLDVLGRCLRQQSVYGFLYLFFDRLGSAVTSYAAYMMDGAAAALRAARVGSSAEDRVLWTRVLQTLTAAFTHDGGGSSGGGGDSFWQVPTHFEAVAGALVEQFGKAKDLSSSSSSTTLLVDHLVPAVVALAKAAHSADHQKELNSLLLKRLQHAGHTAERLALVQCQQALATEVGEEWLAMLPEMLPLLSELQEDSDEAIDRETTRWIHAIESVLGESLDSMLQ